MKRLELALLRVTQEDQPSRAMLDWMNLVHLQLVHLRIENENLNQKVSDIASVNDLWDGS